MSTLPTEATAITVSRAEAARLLGVSLRHFEVRVMPRIRTVKVGRSRLVPVAELRRFVEANQS